MRESGHKIIAGIDEAGRGPIAGPVVAAAVVLSDDIRIEGLRDSKKVPEKEREKLFREILAVAVDIGVGISDHEDIDRMNILQATRKAMEDAVKDLRCLPDLLVIDAVTLPRLDIRQLSPVKAESKSASVAAASIVAKYVRDMAMLRYHDMYPQYNFNKHKGYGTKEHLDRVMIHGPSAIHRKSFRTLSSPGLPY